MLRTSSFRQGPAITDTLQYLRSQGDSLCATAVKHFQRLCKTNDVPVLQTPQGTELLSASWIEETEPARLLFHSRHSDLVVLGRPRNEDYMPGGLIESVLLGSGRPVVLAPETMPRSATGTIVVGWKETPEAARALAVSLPLLRHANRVVLMTVAEEGAASLEALRDLARRSVRRQTFDGGTADGSGCRAAGGSLVLGGFGH